MLSAAEPVVHTGLSLFLPTWPDIIWSAVVLAIIAFAFYRFIMPKFMDILDKRTAMIDGGIKQAEQVREAAQQTLAERHKMLEEAQVEAAKTRDQARAEGDAIIREARENATREAARIEATAQRNLESQRAIAETQLRAEVGHLATQLAGKIIGAALVNEATKTATIDRFIDELEQADLGGGKGVDNQTRDDLGQGVRRRRRGGSTEPQADDLGTGALATATLVQTDSDLNPAFVVEDAEFGTEAAPDGNPDLVDTEGTEPIVTSVVKERRHLFRK